MSREEITPRNDRERRALGEIAEIDNTRATRPMIRGAPVTRRPSPTTKRSGSSPSATATRRW